MSYYVSLWRHLVHGYPKEQVLVYTCSRNGVTGVVRAVDFDAEVLKMRREHDRLAKKKYLNRKSLRPIVYPVFLFSDKTPGKHSFRVGTIEDMYALLKDCALEERAFELPPINGGVITPVDYSGLNWEQVGREGTRHKVYTLEQARNYIYQ